MWERERELCSTMCPHLSAPLVLCPIPGNGSLLDLFHHSLLVGDFSLSWLVPSKYHHLQLIGNNFVDQFLLTLDLGNNHGFHFVSHIWLKVQQKSLLLHHPINNTIPSCGGRVLPLSSLILIFFLCQIINNVPVKKTLVLYTSHYCCILLLDLYPPSIHL